MWKTILDHRNAVIPSQDSSQSLQSKVISCHIKSLYKPQVQSIVSPQLVKKCKLAKCHHDINAKPLPSHCTTCTSQSDRLTLDKISSTERKACFSHYLRHQRCLLWQINMKKYDNINFLKGIVLSAIAMWFIDETLFLFAAWTIFDHIYFCHEKTKMMSETPQNMILNHSTSLYVI